MKKLLSLMAIGLLVTSFWACDEDDPAKDAPTATAPTGITTVLLEEDVDVEFDIKSPGGYASVVAAPIGGTATVKSQPTNGATTGKVVVTFSAGTNEGAATVVITVTDKAGKTGTATAVLQVTEFPTTNVYFNIEEDETWETGNIYILRGRITVLDGVTLTIEPGVIIKGDAGTGANATALLIARGGKLMAEGTADEPIIFTSISDGINPGEIEGTLATNLNGLWGGLLILGKAPISADAQAVQIEGIPPSDTNGLYGGTVADDNSGIIKYISIRHGGANIGEGNEINGLTLGGVGSGTVIENVEVVANQDDGIEWFGGTVNVKNAIVWNAGDDAIDTDQSWSGTLDNFVVITPGDECFELDGPEGALLANNTHTIINGTVLAGDAEGLVDLDADSYVNLSKIYFNNIKAGQDVDLVACTSGSCPFTDLQFTIPGGTTLGSFFAGGTAPAGATEVAAGANTVGADLTKFAGWSLAATSGAID